MSTKWETIAIPFQGGIDTKSDAKAAPPTKLIELDNGVFTKRGSIRKRHGYDLTKALDIDGSVVDGDVLAVRGDSMALLGDDRTYTYQESSEKWIDDGYYNRTTVSSDEVEASSESRTLGARAENNGVTVRAWLNMAGELEIEISDTTTGAIIKNVTDATIASGTKPQCVRTGDFLNVLFAIGGSTDLMALPINTHKAEETLAADAVIIASDLHADEIYDVVENSTQANALFAWYSTGSNEFRWGRLLPGGSTEAKNGTSTSAIVAIAIAASAEYLLLSFVTATQVICGKIEDVNGSMTISTDSLDANITNYDKVSVAVSSTKFAIMAEAQVASQEDQTIDIIYGDVTDIAGATYTADSLRHSSLASHGFTIDDKMYAFVKHETHNQVQNSCYLMELHTGEAESAVVGQINLGTTTPVDAEPHLPRFALTDDSKLAGILPFRKTVAATNDNAFMHAGMSEVVVDCLDSAYTAVEAGGALYVPGGQCWYLDGKEPVEAGFATFPELDIEFGSTAPADHAAVDVATAGAIPAATYGYKVFYEWTGATGEIMRSSAIPFSVAAPGSFKVKLTIPTLFHTLKGLTSRDDISVAVFRTAAGLNKYHRCSGTDPTVVTGDNHYLFNDRGANTVEFTDNMLDAVLLTRELDPTIGGILDNPAFPSCSIMVGAKRRLFMAGGDVASNRVAYSKLRIDGRPVEFNDALTVEVPDWGGPVTGLSAMSDTLVIFKEDQIYGVAGDGPNNLGFGDFQDAVLVSTDVGCIDHRTVVEVPEGIMFQSKRGIFLLNRDFNVTYVGADAELFNDQVISSAELLPDQNAVIFLSPDGTTLWYDYLFGQWSTFTAHQGVSGVLWQDKYCFLRSNGEVMRQNSSKYTDGNVAYRLRAKTAPIRLDDLQNFWRVKRVYVLGEYFSAHDLRMNIWFNREGAPQETVTWDTSDFISTDTWGSQATWGADDAWGSDINGRDYQMSYVPARQKCQSINLEFQEIPGTEPGRSFELTEIALMWGQVSGLGRLDSSRRK